MSQDKAIKILAIANLVSLPIVVVLSLYLESSLPPLLIGYLEQEMERKSTTLELVVSLLTIPVLLVHIAALFGVLLFKPWSRAPLLCTSLLFYLLAPFLGPYVDHGISASLDSSTSLILGALLALLFFGQSTFNKLSQQDATSGASA